jgi:hypothetical protein
VRLIPSLTITALAEHAMDAIPARSGAVPATEALRSR